MLFIITPLTATRLQRNQTASPLLQLPAELRNTIYHHVLGFKQIRIIISKSRAHTFTIRTRCTSATPPGNWEAPVHLIALTQACRQIHFETSQLIFSLNEFDARHLFRFQDLLAALTPMQLKSITTLRLQVHDVCLKETVTLTRSMPYRIRPACLQVLKDLSGLERVVLQEWSEWVDNGYLKKAGLTSHLARKMIQMNVQNEDLELMTEEVSYADPCENLGLSEKDV